LNTQALDHTSGAQPIVLPCRISRITQKVTNEFSQNVRTG